MNRRISFKIFIAVVCLVFALTMTATTAFFVFVIVPARDKNTFAYNQKLIEINSLVEKYYIGEYDGKMISDGVSYGFLVGLEDKYAGYITAEDAQENMDSLLGYNSGMGVQVTRHPDTGYVYILAVHKDSPAENAGIQPKDQIIQLDDKKVLETGYVAAIDYIKTVPNGQIIKTIVLRDGKELTLDVQLMQFESQTIFSQKVGNKGYIQISSFNDKTVEQFKQAVDYFVAEKVDGLVFDVRGNSGGTLSSVYHMVDYLVPEGLVVRVDYKDDSYDQTYLSDDKEIDLPMIVLTDENTASASELFTQSLIDYGKAVSVGRKTFGKGVVQRTFTLSDQSLIRITVAKYYTNSGKCVDGDGIEPTVPVEWEQNELSYRLVNGIEVDKDFLAAVEYLDSQLS